MTNPRTAYMISTDMNKTEGVFIDTVEQALIFVGRMIEKLNGDENFSDKFIYITEYVSDNDDGNYIIKEHGFSNKYLITK